MSSSILFVNHGIVSPTVNVNPTLFVISCKKKLGDYRATSMHLLSLTNNFSSKFQSSMTIFEDKLLTRETHIIGHMVFG